MLLGRSWFTAAKSETGYPNLRERKSVQVTIREPGGSGHQLYAHRRRKHQYHRAPRKPHLRLYRRQPGEGGLMRLRRTPLVKNVS